jgi:hypothetical protein
VKVSWPSTRCASAASLQTTLSAPQRSPYSEKFFENEFATIIGTSADASIRTHAASSSRPSPKP